MKIIKLDSAPLMFLYNITWDDIWDRFDYEHSFMYPIELDMYGNPLPEKQTSLFRSISEHAEDNVW